MARQRDGILPEFPIWDDVTTFRLDNPQTEEYIRFLVGIREKLTIAGGFPCQDISIAGKGAGIEGSRSGLWGEMCRIISEIRPRYILLENSPMLIVRGFERVITDLAEIRYCLAWSVMGAADIGANHQRDRFWGFGVAEEYLDRERDTHSDSDSDRCVRFIRGGRSCETEDNFRGISLARLVEVEPHKIWHTPTTMDTLPPKSQEALIKEAATRPNRKNPANLRDMVSQQDKWNEIQKGSQTTMFDKPKKVNGGGYDLSDSGCIRSETRVSESEQRQERDTEEPDNRGGREKFPTPCARDWKGGIANPEHLQSADGRFNRMGNLDTFVRFYRGKRDNLSDSEGEG